MLVFLGGLSAATAMVVVASTALATMISNDIAAPLLWRQRLEDGASLGRRVLWLRRAVIVTLALLAFAYYRSTSDSTSLAAIGMLAFAAVAQFAPGIFAALYWSGASRAGVFWGMLSGFITWGYLLFLPNLVAGGLLASADCSAACAAWLWPQDYSNLRCGAVGPRALLALTLNVLVMLVGVGAPRRDLAGATGRARLRPPKRPAAGLPAITSKVGDLETVAARIIGAAARARRCRSTRARRGHELPKPAEPADRGLLQHFERVLAGSIGASSARVVLTPRAQAQGPGGRRGGRTAR